MIYRTEQRVAQLREEALMTQVPRTDPGFYFPFREHTGQCGCFWDYFKKRVMNRNLNGILLFWSDVCRCAHIQNRFDHTAALSFNKQAAVSHELKKWCMSQLKDADVHIPAKAQCYKLLPSPSVEQSLADTDLESLPLLSMVSGDSSTSLANYVNILPSASTHSVEGPVQEQLGRSTYFEMKVKRSSGMSKNNYLELQQHQQVSCDTIKTW